MGGFATEAAFGSPGAGRLLLDAVDGPSWLVEFGVRNVVTVDPSVGIPVDATVRGTSDELYRWAWNRPVPGIHPAGSERVLERWRAVRIA